LNNASNINSDIPGHSTRYNRLYIGESMKYTTYKKYKKMEKETKKLIKILNKLSLRFDWIDTNTIIRHKVMRGEW